ncbi:hypothetical protein EDI_196900 [Entamoeba dispar SAW760]|uniref:EF-hand domain-containing protein n=2 Tax=Entamoeba dispar (strain ATCC PRA-260 / SAW760) TaxID=370354 RepID=B0EE14_ENTDS|nr:uncharacterized protein EDI_196900 [Entamoeba dispar SAW760]EDR27234.1 hypothetical protein EDI_196900 [Entamoeba dispar SAW760]|eukprot:EDR27234.1 hypothetical protein EDI_196900 [Entamoeba dispar SAW760]
MISPTNVFKEIDKDKDELITLEEALKGVHYEKEEKEFKQFEENVLLIIDSDNDNKITCKEFKQFFKIIEIAQNIKICQKMNFTNIQIPFPETEKLKLYFRCFKTNKKGEITTEQILNWSRKIKDPQQQVFIETSLRNMNSNKCDEQLFTKCFISPDGYIMEYCPKYINVFKEIDLNQNGKIDIQEIMYHISRIFTVPENMRDFFTIVIKLLDSDGDNELNLVEFVKYCLALNHLFDFSKGGEITKDHMLMVLYELVDIDGSGLIDRMEMERYFNILHTPFDTRETVRNIMKQCGGVIDFEVFKYLYS